MAGALGKVFHLERGATLLEFTVGVCEAVLIPVLGFTVFPWESPAFSARPHARAAAFIFSCCSRVGGVAGLTDGFVKPFSAIHEIWLEDGVGCFAALLSAETRDGNMIAAEGRTRRSRNFFIQRIVVASTVRAENLR